MKKAANWLPFFLPGAIFRCLDHKKKRAGRGGSARTGKSLRGVNSKERVRSRIHLQAQRNFCVRMIGEFPVVGTSSHALPVFLVVRISRSSSTGPDKSGYCSGFLPHPLFFKTLAAGVPHTKRWSVNALWGKLPGMAVTKCILLKEDERPDGRNPAFWTLLFEFESVFTTSNHDFFSRRC